MDLRVELNQKLKKFSEIPDSLYKSVQPLATNSPLKDYTSRSIISLGFGALGNSDTSGMGTSSLFTSASMYLSLRSISSQRRTSLTNLRWNRLTSSLSCVIWTSMVNYRVRRFSTDLTNLRLWTARYQSHPIRISQNRLLLAEWTTETESSARCGTCHPSWMIIIMKPLALYNVLERF